MNDRQYEMSLELKELQHCQGLMETNITHNLLAISQDICKHQQANDEAWNQFSSTIEHERALITQRAILETLKYERMSQRKSNIIEAHIGTFEWIFDPLRVGFMHWLREGGDIYWINGNAGSGKSTLMKYLMGHDVVKNALVDWAGTKPLFTGNYYFWSTGNEMEISLLYIIILIRRVFEPQD
ncbi:hypothetical protein OCU04_004002 [Sclerotinia nivalis]|uniref:Nephrocystin 3-like N-terminal domain-containing protein n=1 Tax=Sclerotinia nivalis TaxID=352851 RepID=A0A9X0DLW6_9HELO|nr:hypothetical protein OCU04_004002 [Sclerotinia nivalis]